MRLLLIAHFGIFSRTFGRMLQQLFQQPAVEIAFVDLLRVPVDFFITLKPENIPCHAAFVGVFAGLVVFRATVEGSVFGIFYST